MKRYKMNHLMMYKILNIKIMILFSPSSLVRKDQDQ